MMRRETGIERLAPSSATPMRGLPDLQLHTIIVPQRMDAMCQQRTHAPQQRAYSFDRLVDGGTQGWRNVPGQEMLTDRP
jgi:hypothetical protein